MKFRTEREMMLELSLVAERECEIFKLFDLNLVLFKTSYRSYCLDIHYLADNRKDKVVKLVPNANPNQPALYCLLSELPASL
ncbi:hypothetical protein [Gallibacterium anatis]|uniref:hypothetical protein n=1 Tax=Gallibacterium anatis TaxID=750 RepID=UPI000531A080|nr:hypothetical protein [Gallibacterium anatis]KGQ39962.1 hypothetical protein JP30_09135 [Gallibacterium anatis IPDH697-78]